YAHRQLIGYVGMVLPPLLWLITIWRPTGVKDQVPWAPLSSISAYYYTGAVSVFAGCLVALALFFFAYRGYNNEYGHRDRVAAFIAGLAAIVVAFFPSEAPIGLSEPSWWTVAMKNMHYAGAVFLFGSFIFFSLFQFPRSAENPEKLSADKQSRNRIYIFCGVAMVLSMVWVIVAIFMNASIFWPETLALEFFAVSWLVKGRADQTAIAVGKRTLHYGRHPRQLAAKTWSIMSGK
ncbi:MAG: hypothetical protein NT121_20070, partial [Chloroflexi bacterium]|nr:hypothetical protein [Chloroflexota bacterium]